MAKSSTSFKKGNKAAVDHGFGRPRNYDINEEALALLDWAKKPTSLVLNGFAPTRGYSSKSMYQWETESPVFLEAMNVARDLICQRLQEILISKGNARPFDRYAPLLDKNLHMFERGEKIFDIEQKLKADKASGASVEQEKAHEQLIEQIKQLQDSARRLAANSKSTESKS